ncbi:TolC family protein [Pseudorhodoferax soli]|uniref:Outer membrane protein TolC n=1 Tax=Pseudorhodoferax soli TaxID=545864 RepID=A0A368XDN5_9BURK|nr:TolC family protein [Pseudorhodoferax soli]RCW66073.1 outer membrane protein TolC [Pseudorhodoferax soli]
MFTFPLRAAFLVAAMLPALAAAASLTLDQALDLAVRRSDATHAARAGVAGANETARAAGQLSDPTLRLGVDNLPMTGGDRFSTTRESMTMKRIGIGQEWVSADKRAARQAAAEAVAIRESVSLLAAAGDVRMQTAQAYLDVYFAGEALKLATQTEHHLHEELEAAKGRLSSAAGSSQDVLALASARGIAEDDTADVLQQERGARVALERWVGVAADELAAPSGLTNGGEASYVANHPAVLAARRGTEVARQEAAVAAANRKPNWSWEVSYGQRSGYSDMLSVGVSIPLPVAPAQRQDRDTAAKLALVEKAEANLVEATRTASAEFQRLASDAQRLAQRAERYQSSVVAPAQQRTAVALAGYRSNQVSLTTLFEARHAEVDAQRKLLSLQRDLAKVRAQLAFTPLLPGDAQ